MKYLTLTWQLLKETFNEWNGGSASRASASLAYYAIFSLPGLLIIVIWVAGLFFGDEAVRGQVTAQASGIAGKEIAASLQTMIASAVWDNQNVVMKIFGILTLIFGATTLFFEMQRSLNTMWDVEAAPKKAWRKYILDRANYSRPCQFFRNDSYYFIPALNQSCPVLGSWTRQRLDYTVFQSGNFCPRSDPKFCHQLFGGNGVVCTDV